MDATKCKCVNIEIGSYGNQVELPAPRHMGEWAGKVGFSLGGNRKTICIDRCLEAEIKNLWRQGVITTGCCCGHGKAAPYIGVAKECIPAMKAMGYKVKLNELYPESKEDFVPLSTC